MSARQTAALNGTTTTDKKKLLFGRGINFSELPLLQRRGIGVWWETVVKDGFNPVTHERVTVDRRRLHIERELPMKDEYRNLVRHAQH